MPLDLRETSISGIPETATQGGIVNKLILSTGAVAAALAIVVAGALAAGTVVVKTIAFVGTYAGNAVTNANGNTVSITANGTGKGTMIGAGKITGVGTADSSSSPCVPFIGTGKITAAGGTVTFKVIPGSTGCGDQQGENFTISGKATILKATGKLLKRKGTPEADGYLRPHQRRLHRQVPRLAPSNDAATFSSRRNDAQVLP